MLLLPRLLKVYLASILDDQLSLLLSEYVFMELSDQFLGMGDGAGAMLLLERDADSLCFNCREKKHR